MKILVTGGAGFIGSNLVDSLVLAGHDVSVIDNFSTGTKANCNRQARYIELSINDEKLSGVFAQIKPDVVIHLSAQVSVKNSIINPRFDAASNILGTITLLEQCVKHDVKKFIFASSAAVYGRPVYLGIDEKHPLRPMSHYGVSKMSSEYYTILYSDMYGIDYTILRYANVYGMRQNSDGEGGVVSVFINNLLKKKPIVIYGDGNQTRDFIHVHDVVSANLAALQRGSKGVFNISSGTSTSINELVQMLDHIAGTHSTPLYQPKRIGDIDHSYLINDLAIKELDWRPAYGITQGLTETYHWYAENMNAIWAT